jgi:hypothetical protein
MLFRDSRFPAARSFWGSKPLPVLPAMKKVGDIISYYVAK